MSFLHSIFVHMRPARQRRFGGITWGEWQHRINGLRRGDDPALHDLAVAALGEALRGREPGPVGPAGIRGLTTLVLGDAPAFTRFLALAVLGTDPSACGQSECLFVQVLCDPDEAVRRAAAIFLYRLGTVTALAAVAGSGGHGHGIRSDAAHKLRDMGPAAAAAVPALLRMIFGDDGLNWRSTFHAADALAAIGPASLPALLLVLRHPKANPCAIAATIDALEQLGPAAVSALPEVLPLLTSADETQRLAAAEVAWAIGGRLDGLSVVIAALGSRDASHRQRALHAVAAFGPYACSAKQHIEPLLNDDDELVRKAAADAITSINGPATPATAIRHPDSPTIPT